MDKLQRFKFLTQYISDLHLEKNFPRNIKAEKPFLILAGDIGYPFQKSYVDFLQSLSYQFDKVFIITGNHEYDDFTKPNASSNFDDSEYLWRYIKYCQ